MAEKESTVKIEEGDEPVYVAEITVSNYRSIQLINLTPEQLWTVLVGENGAGKSSILEALESICEGGSPGIDIVRHGEDEAEIILHLTDGETGHLYIKKKFREPGKFSIEVRRSPNGPKVPAEMTIINAIKPRLLDPSRLYRSKPDERISMLMKAVGLGDQLAAIDAAEKQLIKDREIVGHDRRNKKGELDGIPFPPLDTPDELLDTAELVEKKNAIGAVRADHAKKRQSVIYYKGLRDTDNAKVKDTAQRIDSLREEVRRLEAELESQREAACTSEESYMAAKSEAESLIDPDTSEVDNRLANSKTINANVANKQRRQRVQSEIDSLNAKWNGIDEQVRACSTRKEELLAAAPWPYPGMGFGNGDITLDGCLWTNISDGKRCMISAAVAVALQPRLKMATLKEAVWLSPTNIRIVQDMLEQHGIFSLVERQLGTSDGLLIEDGRISGKVVNGEIVRDAEVTEPEAEVAA